MNTLKAAIALPIFVTVVLLTALFRGAGNGLRAAADFFYAAEARISPFRGWL